MGWRVTDKLILIEVGSGPPLPLKQLTTLRRQLRQASPLFRIDIFTWLTQMDDDSGYDLPERFRQLDRGLGARTVDDIGDLLDIFPELLDCRRPQLDDVG